MSDTALLSGDGVDTTYDVAHRLQSKYDDVIAGLAEARELINFLRRRHPVKVLLVEDDDTIGQALVYALRDQGFTVYHSPTPEKALALVESIFPINLGLLDIMLPHMSGNDLARKLLSIAPDLPLLGMSASREQANLAAATGCYKAVVHKPFDLDEIERLIVKYAQVERSESQDA